MTSQSRHELFVNSRRQSSPEVLLSRLELCAALLRTLSLRIFIELLACSKMGNLLDGVLKNDSSYLVSTLYIFPVLLYLYFAKMIFVVIFSQRLPSHRVLEHRELQELRLSATRQLTRRSSEPNVQLAVPLVVTVDIHSCPANIGAASSIHVC